MKSPRITLAVALAATASAAALLTAPVPALTPAASQPDPATPMPFVTQRATKGTEVAGRPAIKVWAIPYGAKRKREMAAYSKRHYGRYRWRLRRPQAIVEHMAQAPSAAAVHAIFAPDRPDPELGELPNVCTHFVISGSGRIFRLVNLRTRCRHTVGLNWTAIGIEHAGYGDGDVLGNRRALRASLRLTRWLRCRFGIRVRDVIGHAESLSSPFHHELVPSLRNQTHGDWRHSSMRTYRRKLRRLGRC
jgi:hypothetical protein